MLRLLATEKTTLILHPDHSGTFVATRLTTDREVTGHRPTGLRRSTEVAGRGIAGCGIRTMILGHIPRDNLETGRAHLEIYSGLRPPI